MRVKKNPCGIGRSNENGGRLLGMDFNVSLSEGRTVTLIQKIRWKAEYDDLVTGLPEGWRTTRQVLWPRPLVRHSSDHGSVKRKLGAAGRSVQHGSVQGQFLRLSERNYMYLLSRGTRESLSLDLHSPHSSWVSRVRNDELTRLPFAKRAR
ncbi:hypothetical protein CROQUDRAFT_412839 [Cronartium quercuum f. sp. fusiforme G11]|uniref:Uncharacterized protein n=1 Tax=Cronartium quercuum f. sp. fusiforme G11 TaxID=708437 RepID=A0A9P6N9U3_9BASI|nr:hypothetical protein CROQUDRAFT_412839 [Cronartium quercuum f. sp. fusiforme G11]